MFRRTSIALLVSISLVLLSLARPGFAVLTYGSAGSPIPILTESAHPHAFPAFGTWGTIAQYQGASPATTWARFFDNTMVPLGEVGQADAYPTNDPAAAASDSYLLVVYGTTPTTGGGGTAVLTALLYDIQGNLLDAEILDTNPSDEPHLDMEIGVDPDSGNFLVVWRQPAGTSASEVWGKLVVVVAGQIGGPANASFYGDAWLADGLDVAHCAREEPPRSGNVVERFLVAYRAFAGIQVTSVETALGTRMSDVVVGTGSQPHIATRGVGGESLVVWNESETIRARRIWPSGTLPAAAFTVAGSGQWPDVASSATEYLVAYREPPMAGAEAILGQYLSAGADPLGSEFTVVPAYDTLGAPSVASDGSVFLVAYTRTNGAGSPAPTDVFASRVSPGVFTFVDDEIDDPQDATRGVALGDWTQPEEYPDLYVANTNGQGNQPFKNDEGAFVFGLALGGHDPANGQGIAQADVDNDGDLDMLVSNAGQANSLWLAAPSPFWLEWNAADPTALDDGAYDSRSVSAADYDGDGLVDFCVANKNGRNSLLHNDGGTFSDASAALGLEAANTEGVAFGDFDDDGDVDLYVGNAGSANRLYVNDGTGFSPANEMAAAYGLADAGSARTVTWVDFDGDADLDLFVSRYGEANSLYRNDGSTFMDVSAMSGIADTGRGESACFADMDLDGDMDLFLADFNDPDRLYRNDGGTFVEVGSIIGLEDDGPSLGAAWGDVDLDGDPDLVVGGYGGANRLYLNEMQSTNDWVQIRLIGTVSNASAIGARVEVLNGPQTLVQWVGTGSGYLSQNDLTLIFGLGSAAPKSGTVGVTVTWPHGLVESFPGVSTQSKVTLTEGTGSATAVGDAPRHALVLHENTPNPFNPATTISFELPEAGSIDLSVYDSRGRHVATLASGSFAAGTHEETWRGQDDRRMAVASGVYFYTLRTPRMQVTRRMALVR